MIGLLSNVGICFWLTPVHDAVGTAASVSATYAFLAVLSVYDNPAEYPVIYGGDECGAGIRGMQSPSSPFKMPRHLWRGASLLYKIDESQISRCDYSD